MISFEILVNISGSSLKGEYAMPMITKCYAEVFYVKHKLVTFDFGNFAIVVKYDSGQDRNEINIYFYDDYEKKFMGDWIFKIGPVTNSVKINHKDFEDIKEISLKCMEKCRTGDFIKLFCLLQKSFPEQIELYGR